jgi:peptidoglycan/LPS O-acetylase OafA/YrhL
LKINYRPEIDGLRCIAVLSVVFYHAQLNLFDEHFLSGGFIGVDIFFVISGYLITSIILKELSEKDNFSFKYFYERRARRILPVLLFIILISIPFAWIYFYPIELVNFAKSILYSLGFVSNFYFYYSGLEYGSPESILKPFLHMWSLSIEEQYYVLFPFILVAIYKYFRQYIFHILLISLLVSLFFADWSSKTYFSYTFYFIQTRAWELLCGSILAYFEIKFNNTRSKNKTLNEILPLIGFFLIVYSFFFFNDDTFHPSLITVIPIVGVMLILWFTNNGNVMTNILSHKLFVGVGLISYSLYLWHYVVFSFAKNIEVLFDNNAGKMILILISVTLSIFTYFFIEQPARKKTSVKIIFSFLITGLVVILFLSSAIILNNGFSSRIKVKNYQEKPTFMYLMQNDKICFNRLGPDYCHFGKHEKKIIVVGDSQLASLAYDLNEKVKNKYSFIPIVSESFFYFKESYLLNKKTKKINLDYNRERDNIKKILNQSENNIIIIGGASSLYFYNKRVKNKDPHFYSHFVDSKNLKNNPKKLEKEFLAGINELSLKNDIILLYPIPEIGVNLQKKTLKNKLRTYKYYYSDFLEQNKEVINLYDSINLPNVYKVFPYKKFCNQESNLCLTHNNNEFFFFDGYHPSLTGAKMINELIMDQIKKIDLKK